MNIFYDVDTQHDFMDKDGALYVPGAEDIKPNLKKLTDYASASSHPIRIIGSMDVHHGTSEYKSMEGELNRYGGPFPDHCMIGTRGQEKIDETTPYSSSYYKKREKMREDIPRERFTHYSLDDKASLDEIKETDRAKSPHSNEYYNDQGYNVFFQKQSFDIFTNPDFETFLKEASVKEAVVYGVATDYCVKAAVLGMQKRGIQCYVVTDAIAAVTPETGKSALEEMVNAGAKLTTTNEVLAGKVFEEYNK
ncbi:isochorismatase family protein [Candidatus Woesearchaeota archaeon]|nr:isochorismatase family protein [Candidatus Woesearchaeota archaeon]